MPFTVINHFMSASQEAKKRPVVAVLPGGPGLSSHTVEVFSGLVTVADVSLIDPPDTGRALRPERFDYLSTLEDIEAALAELARPIILVGHSFGGVQAMDLVLRKKLDVRALVCLASPILQSTYETAAKISAELKTPEMNKCGERFGELPTRERFDKFFAAVAPLYFSPEFVELGRKWLAKDRTSADLFLGCYGEGTQRGAGLAELAKRKLKKVMIAAGNDALYPASSLEPAAVLGGFEFHEWDRVGHFLTFEAPDACIDLVTEIIYFSGGLFEN